MQVIKIDEWKNREMSEPEEPDWKVEPLKNVEVYKVARYGSLGIVNVIPSQNAIFFFTTLGTFSLSLDSFEGSESIKGYITSAGRDEIIYSLIKGKYQEVCGNATAQKMRNHFMNLMSHNPYRDDPMGMVALEAELNEIMGTITYRSSLFDALDTGRFPVCSELCAIINDTYIVKAFLQHRYTEEARTLWNDIVFPFIKQIDPASKVTAIDLGS